MSSVICKLPKTGLGNQLFPMLKAIVFAHLNHLPLNITGFYKINPGVYLRKEKSKRQCTGYFIFQKSLAAEILDKIKNWFLTKRNNCVYGPAIERIEHKGIQDNRIFIFNNLPHWSNYFEGLKLHRQLVIDLFYSVLRPEIAKLVESKEKPIIAVHIRMGDFKKLSPGVDFKKVGGVRTPEQYFIDCINTIRKIHGTILPVSIFSDGSRDELKKILELPATELVEGNKDVVDLILLSKAKIVVASAGSTFSYWAGFLADAPLIMHPDHIHDSIRDSTTNQLYYEGPLINLSEFPELLVKNICQI